MLWKFSSADDQAVILALTECTKGKAQKNQLVFVDARKALAALGNKAKGKGTENISKDYKGS